MAKSKLLFTSNEWTFDLLRKADDAIREIAMDELHLNIYPNQMEIISSEQMLEAYSSHGLPIMYPHWSFGKQFIQEQYTYRKGLRGLAYEIVINSSPCIAYLMEDNTMTMQALVIAHASYGHNHFFKNNHLFREWTSADSIVDYLSFAKKYIQQCEEKYGLSAVEDVLDACHALMNHGIDRYKRPQPLNKQKEIERQQAREEYVQKSASELWKSIPTTSKDEPAESSSSNIVEDPQENILYFVEKYSPKLEGWQREIVRIVRKLAQYFWPMMQTQVGNEGWASFCHYYIMTRLWEKGKISNGSYLEFLDSHTSVLFQLPHSHPYFRGFNPYSLGFDLYSEIRRMCEDPTAEDKELYPSLVNTNWVDACLDAVQNYKDETLIAQFLTPNLIRKRRLFEVTDKENDKVVTISHVQDQRGFDEIRKTMSRQYSISTKIPNIQIVSADLKGDRTLHLEYISHNGAELETKTSKSVLRHLEFLWGYRVDIETKKNTTE